MAGIKISALPAIPSSQLTDLGAFVQSGTTYKATLSQIITLFNSSIQLASTSQVTGLPAALASFLPLAGGMMLGPINMGSNFITNLLDPVNPQDAATKNYADTIASGFTVILAALAATTANLNATPAGAGVGATLTNAGAMAAFSVDGVSPAINSRILVKDQTLTQHNGVYTLTTVGSGAVNWVLTRATDYDQAAEIQPGTLIAVNTGTVNANTSWLETATVVTVDTDPILFSQFTFAPGSFFLIANNLSEGVPATMRTNLGLGTVATKTASDNTKTIASMLNGATTIGHLAVFSDITGTIEDGGPVPTGMATNDICNGRMTLTSNVPVTTTDITAAITVFFTPFKGNQISLFDGAATWETITFTEASIAVPAVANQMYDLFAYNNAGTIALETQAWTSDTARAISLVFQDGVYVKNGTTTRRYLGSFRTTSVAGRTEDSNANRQVWNYYNRVDRPMNNAAETANSWTYSSSTFRQANNNTANKITFVIGVSEDTVHASVGSRAQGNNTNTVPCVGIGLDSVTVSSPRVSIPQGTQVANVGSVSPYAIYNDLISAGYHYLAWLESNRTNANTVTWFGDNNDPPATQSGITGTLPA